MSSTPVVRLRDTSTSIGIWPELKADTGSPNVSVNTRAIQRVGDDWNLSGNPDDPLSGFIRPNWETHEAWESEQFTFTQAAEGIPSDWNPNVPPTFDAMTGTWDTTSGTWEQTIPSPNPPDVEGEPATVISLEGNPLVTANKIPVVTIGKLISNGATINSASPDTFTNSSEDLDRLTWDQGVFPNFKEPKTWGTI